MNGVHDIPQPIPYQGSKRLLAPDILRFIPPSTKRLVEPFAGSAAVTIAAASRRLAPRFWINDAHEPLASLWREILQRPSELAEAYATLWEEQLGQERIYFDQIRVRFNQAHAPADFLYLLARCVKAAIRYNSSGEFNNTPDNRRRGARPSEMRRRILAASALLQGRTRITSWDYTKVLEKCSPSDLVYMDPPYQGVCGNRDQRYLPRIDHEEFCDQLHLLLKKDIDFIVSYDGRTGAKTFGQPLPASLGLLHLEIHAGRSTQATLLGRNDDTFESLYVSPRPAGIARELGRLRKKQTCIW